VSAPHPSPPPEGEGAVPPRPGGEGAVPPLPLGEGRGEGWRLGRGNLLAYLILTAGAVVLLLPLAWAVSGSLKETAQVFTTPVQWVSNPIRPENYLRPFQQKPILTYFANSLLVSTVVTATTLLFSALAGYSLAKFRYRGRGLIFVFIISTMMLPVQVTLIPLYLLVRQLGWIDTYAGLIVPQAMSAFGVFLVRQHLLALPDDFLDAARIDGASEARIFWQIVVPMSGPALSALTILTFLGSWDNFIWPLVVVNSDAMRTLPLGMQLFFGEYQTRYNEVLALAVIIAAPVLVVFFVMQRQFIEGMALSGVKG